jgi:DNA-binding transcriptional ArsR family regulator
MRLAFVHGINNENNTPKSIEHDWWHALVQGWTAVELREFYIRHHRSSYLCFDKGSFGQNIDMAIVGALIGDPARANILAALMDGRALTATELAYIAGVAPQTASGHLAKLTDANLIALTKQGRYRYYRLASALVGRMLEGIMAVAAVQAPPRRRTVSHVDEQMRNSRTCYDHITGRLGVALADALVERGHIVLAEDGGEITQRGADFLSSFGIELARRKKSHRAFCRPCLDWSERRPHIAGIVGATLCRRCLELDWIERCQDTRALAITVTGLRGLSETFGIHLQR